MVDKTPLISKRIKHVEKKPLVILVGIDCLFDTFLASILSIYPNKLQDLLQAGYHERIHNEIDLLLPDIDMSKVWYVYHNRDIKILRKSKSTVLKYTMRRFCMSKKILINPSTIEEYMPEIWINIYPYRMTPHELKALVVAFKTIVDIPKILIVDKSIKELSPDALKPNVHDLFLYDPQEWLQYHTEALKDTVLWDRCLHIPHIAYYDRYKKTMEKAGQGIVDKTRWFKSIPDLVTYRRELQRVYTGLLKIDVFSSMEVSIGLEFVNMLQVNQKHADTQRVST